MQWYLIETRGLAWTDMAFPNWGIISSTLGMRYGSGLVLLLILLKSMHRRTVPSGFRTGTMEVDHGLREGIKVPDSCNVRISSLSWSLQAGAILDMPKWLFVTMSIK